MVSNANANNIPAYRLHSKFVNNIIDSMVLWYDIKRQGATNESMSQKPVLRDLSGNGHDATCYNFAWSGMSSIGGYSTSFLGNGWAHMPEFVNANDTSCIFTKARNSFSFLYHTGYLDEFNIKVTGITDTGCRLEFGQGDIEESEHSIKSDGVYTIPAVTVETTKGFKLYGDNSLTFNIKIELLPQYPNALVSDGVDDYCLVDELPILTDYTIVAKRTDLSVIPDTVLASKRKQGVGTGDVSGAFQLERHFASNWTAFNFGSQNTINKSTDDIIYQTKSNYCGQNLSIGTAQDSDTMTLFKWNELSTVCANIALYSIILFNRTLTTEEIEWVKKNMIEGDLVLPSLELDPSLIDAWIFSGHTNAEAPAEILGEKGTALACNNFAWNEEDRRNLTNYI